MNTITDLQQLDTPTSVIAEEMLQNEFDFIMAQQMLKKMLDNSMISEGEFNKISELNRRNFSPELTSIMPTNT